MARAKDKQLSLQLPPGRGGARKHAGRKLRGARRSTPHRRRAPHVSRNPIHVTMRARRGLSTLRTQVTLKAIMGAIKQAARSDFRIAHYSVQRDHLHLLCEAESTKALSAGMRGLAIRMARALNRVLKRTGSLWGDRWHGRALTSPREVRNCLVYVLFNGYKHRELKRGLDPYSSILWAPDSLADAPHPACPCRCRPAPVARGQTWLLAKGWSRHGLLVPADARRMARLAP